MKVKYTIKDFNEQFPDDRACMEFIFATRYPDGGTCKCGKSNCFHPVQKRRSYACAWCGAQIYPTSGTIFHKSETSLKTWFFAMFLMSSSKNGVAALELQRQTGVTYKTAHRMPQRGILHQTESIGRVSLSALCGVSRAKWCEADVRQRVGERWQRWATNCNLGVCILLPHIFPLIATMTRLDPP